MAKATRKLSRREEDLGARFTSLERQHVERAMAKTGQNQTDFIRAAILASADQVLNRDPLAAFAGAIGVLDVPVAFARQSDEVYAEMLLSAHHSARRRTRPAGLDGPPTP